LVLEVQRDRQPTGHPILLRTPLRRHDGELIIEVLNAVLHPLTEREDRGVHKLWDALDEAVDRIQVRVDKGKAPRPADVGEARALTYALSMVLAAYKGDQDAVRAEAMARYDARHGVA
jgi:hypothetical protein